MRTRVPGRRHTLSQAAARLLLPPAALRAPFLLVRSITCDSVSDRSHPGAGRGALSRKHTLCTITLRDSTVPATTTENSRCHSQLRASERPLCQSWPHLNPVDVSVPPPIPRLTAMVTLFLPGYVIEFPLQYDSAARAPYLPFPLDTPTFHIPLGAPRSACMAPQDPPDKGPQSPRPHGCGFRG